MNAPQRIGTGIAAVSAALVLLAPAAALAAEDGDGKGKRPAKKPHLKALTSKETKRAALRELKLVLDDAGSVSKVTCKRRGAHAAVCTAKGVYDSDPDVEYEFEGEGEFDGEEGDDQASAPETWSAKVEVSAHRARKGKRGKGKKRVVRAEVISWTEDGAACDPFAEPEEAPDGGLEGAGEGSPDEAPTDGGEPEAGDEGGEEEQVPACAGFGEEDEGEGEGEGDDPEFEPPHGEGHPPHGEGAPRP